MRIGLDDEGRGEPVVLLHSSCASRRQWGPLVRHLGGRYRTLALDLYGYGDTEFPPHPAAFDIDVEVDLVKRALDRVDGPVHLVGHSYGGAVALATALRCPSRVHSITAHEPVVFRLARTGGLDDVDAEIGRMVATLVEYIEAGAPADAARYFIDYWRDEGTWALLNEKGQQAAARAIRKLPIEFEAILGTPFGLSDYASLPMPVALLAGTIGRSAGRRVTELLATAFGPRALRLLPGVGHMAPATHPDVVNPYILAHLAANPIAARR